jgi:hypothetical protein
MRDGFIFPAILAPERRFGEREFARENLAERVAEIPKLGKNHKQHDENHISFY